MTARVSRTTLALALALGATALAATQDEPAAADPSAMGSGHHRYRWVDDWPQVPDAKDLGNTHGNIAVDAQGRIYLNTDTEQAVMVFEPDGRFVRSFGKELANGLHGMAIVQEGGEEFLLLAHTGRHEVWKTTLAGELVWKIEWPEVSRKYGKKEEFLPTGVAQGPDGRIYVADGYGKSWVHLYDAERNWVKCIGGPGSAPGKMRTPHGLCIDTRGSEPRLLVADRENNRVQAFDLDGEHLAVISGFFRRPCTVAQQGTDLVVADLAGRVTILDGEDQLVLHLGDQPDPNLRAKNKVARELWADGVFLSPHSATWDADGHLYVMDWNSLGRVTKLERLPAEADERDG